MRNGKYYYIKHGIMKNSNEKTNDFPQYGEFLERKRIVFALSDYFDESAILYLNSFDIHEFTNILEKNILSAKEKVMC